MMKKIYCIKCYWYRKSENPKISYIFCKALVLSIICDKCESKDQKRIKAEEPIEILKILGLIENIDEYQINI